MQTAWFISIFYARTLSSTEVALVSYCLVSNHMHLVVTPDNCCGLALALKDTHGRYAVYWNTGSSVERPCVARTLLFLSIGRRASVGSISLCGVEPLVADICGKNALFQRSRGSNGR